jgi:heme exporter protein A
MVLSGFIGGKKMSIEIGLFDINKRYGNKTLYQNLTGTIVSDSCTCITGNNGSGKSTLLKIIAGILKPTTGKIVPLKENTPISMNDYRTYIGMVSPEMYMYENLTARENVQFFTGIVNHEHANDLFPEVLNSVGLANEKESLVKTFSTGMKQRLKLAVLLASDQPVWLLDEPSSNLDEEGRDLVGRCITEGLARKKTIIIATNDPLEVSYAGNLFNLTKN